MLNNTVIIDFHTHIFPDKIAEKSIAHLEELANIKACFNGTFSKFNQLLVRENIDIAVALPVVTKPSQFESVNNYAITVNKEFYLGKSRILSFAGIHPYNDDIKGKMRYLKENGFLGVKIHPDYQDTFIDDDGYYEILKSAKDLDMIVVTHAGVDYGKKDGGVKCPPELSTKLIDRVNYNKFVLAHYGGFLEWENVYNLLAGKNVFLDTSFSLGKISKEIFIKILEKHGDDKILFASDCPWQDSLEAKNLLKSLNLGKETEDKIFYKNAKKLLGI